MMLISPNDWSPAISPLLVPSFKPPSDHSMKNVSMTQRGGVVTRQEISPASSSMVVEPSTGPSVISAPGPTGTAALNVPLVTVSPLTLPQVSSTTSSHWATSRGTATTARRTALPWSLLTLPLNVSMPWSDVMSSDIDSMRQPSRAVANQSNWVAFERTVSDPSTGPLEISAADAFAKVSVTAARHSARNPAMVDLIRMRWSGTRRTSVSVTNNPVIRHGSD